MDITAEAPVSDNRESADDYGHVVAWLNPRWRVIECKDGIQWIIQQRDAETVAAPRWRSKAYHRTRDTLIDAAKLRAGWIDEVAHTILAALPRVIVERRP